MTAGVTSPPEISIVIPCYQDDAALENLLSILSLEAEDTDFETIVVDGGGSDVARALALKHGARYVAERPCRGKQLMTGAKYAVGAFLWFLHADAAPSSAAFLAIKTARAAGRKSGYFQFAFSGANTRFKNALAACINLRARVGGVPYGDQGIFVERTLYWAAGAHQVLPLFEEVALVRQLRRMGECSGLSQPLAVNPRRWDEAGYIKRTFFNRLYALAFMAGYPAEKLARRYRTSAMSRKLDLPASAGES